MNNLSWFLYLTDVIGNVKLLSLCFLIAASVMWGLLNMSVVITEGETLDWADFKKWWVRGVFVILVAGLTTAALPSRNTLYAIAASEVGERVAANEAVQGMASDAAKALHEWIKRQIGDDKAK